MIISKNGFIFLSLFLLFFISRLYILANPAYRPNDNDHAYSDVKHDYERYANMWYYGYTPYLQHYYEYPPATIPLLLIPLILDQNGIGKYYPNYRFGIFVIDIILFLFLYKTVIKLKTPKRSKMLAFLFYTGAGMLAKDFYYEGIDVAFIASLSIAFVCHYLFDQTKLFPRIVMWSFFWLSTAVKFMSLPLMFPIFLTRKLDLKKELIAISIGFLIIWGIPLAIFRSSLSVSIVFHLNRHMKFASLPYFITDTINKFTKTETINNQPPDFNYVGLVATQIEKLFTVLMPVAITLVFLWMLIKLNQQFRYKLKGIKGYFKLLFYSKVPTFNIKIYPFLIQITLVYFFVLFLTGKVFSQPFHIWYVPLLAMFPFTKTKQQLTMYLLALWLIIMDTTRLIKFPDMILIAPLTIDFVRSLLRFLPMIILLIMSIKINRYENG